MLKFILIILLTLPFAAVSQLKVSGRTVHYLTQKKLPLSQVNVIDKTDGSRYSVVLSKGHYRVKLERDKVYHLEFTKAGYYSKFVQIDTRGIPTNKWSVLFIEMDMVEDKLGINQDFFSQAMGKCAYNPALHQMEWDLEYSKMMFEKLNNEYERIGDKSQKESEKKISEQPENLNQQEERELIEISNPFKLIHSIREQIEVEEFSTRNQLVEFKWLFGVGMHFSKLAFNADQKDLDSKIASVKSIQLGVNKVLKVNSIEFKNELIRMGNHSAIQDSIDYIQFEIYSKLKDALMINKNQFFYVDAGSLIESIYQIVIAYEVKPDQKLNTFLYAVRNEFYSYKTLLRNDGKGTDAELSLSTDMAKIESILNKIRPNSTGEKIQDDSSEANYKYIISPELLKELKTGLKGIRSNFL